MTTITSLWRLFQFNLLPFGLHVPSGIFQATIDKLIQGLRGALTYQDDVIVLSATREKHDLLVKLVHSRPIQLNVSVKANKSKFGVSESEFLGFKVCVTGYQPDPGLLKPLAGMESPIDKFHVLSVLEC